MVARLDAIQAGIASSNKSVYAESSDNTYTAAFLSYGLGRTDDEPEVIASRIRASNIRGALVDAIDVWPVALENPGRRARLLQVARLADRDQSSWVVQARDLLARRDRKALNRLCETAPVDAQIVPLLVSLAVDLEGMGAIPYPS